MRLQVTRVSPTDRGASRAAAEARRRRSSPTACAAGARSGLDSTAAQTPANSLAPTELALPPQGVEMRHQQSPLALRDGSGDRLEVTLALLDEQVDDIGDQAR